MGYGATSVCINSTFTTTSTTTLREEKQELCTTSTNVIKTSTVTSSSAATTSKPDDDEPEWLRDVLEAPKRSLENLLISSSSQHSSREKHSADSNSSASSSSSSSILANDVVVVTTASKVETTYDEANDSTTIYITAQSEQHKQHYTPDKYDQQKDSSSPTSLLNRTFIQDSTVDTTFQNNTTNVSTGTTTAESLHESIVSVESTQSDATFNNQTTTIDDSIISSKHNSTYSLADNEQHASLNATTELDDSQYYIPEYPPVRSKEVYVESGVHYFEDGNFWMEVPGKEIKNNRLDYTPELN